VPTGQPGNLWAVFAINEGGEIVDISSIKSVTACVESTGKTAVMKDATTCAGSDSDILGVLGGLAEYLPGAVRPDVPSSNEAVAINRRGEMAYRAGRTNDAIQLFRLAADIDPQFGQAYSNLGLAFQKAGRIAEALWANRQAIQLAEGARAGTVRANAHYNNGRIYEGAGQFPDALREYRQAESEKSSAAYDEAIGRMSEKLHVPSASER
jgi:tetratricopeptide (TPR) repeat protein